MNRVLLEGLPAVVLVLVAVPSANGVPTVTRPLKMLKSKVKSDPCFFAMFKQLMTEKVLRECMQMNFVPGSSDVIWIGSCAMMTTHVSGSDQLGHWLK